MSFRNRQDDAPPPQYRSSYEAVGSTLQELEDIKEQGLFGLMRLRWEAWLADRAAGHIERREKSKQKALEAKQKSVEQAVATARAVEAMQIDHDRQIVAAVESAQRRMIAEASMNPARFIAPPPRPNTYQASSAETDAEEPLSFGAVSDAPPVRPYLHDTQIDAIARHFLNKLPVGDDFEAAWAVFAASLESAVPAQARVESKARAKHLLGLSGGGAGAA